MPSPLKVTLLVVTALLLFICMDSTNFAMAAPMALGSVLVNPANIESMDLAKGEVKLKDGQSVTMAAEQGKDVARRLRQAGFVEITPETTAAANPSPPTDLAASESSENNAAAGEVDDDPDESELASDAGSVANGEPGEVVADPPAESTKETTVEGETEADVEAAADSEAAVADAGAPAE